MTAERLKKEQLIEALVNAGKVDTKKGAVELIESVDAVIEVASEYIEVGQQIALGKYISLEEVNVAEKEGRNPKTGEEITISARKVVSFKVGSALKSKVNA